MQPKQLLFCVTITITLFTSVLCSTYFFGDKTNNSRLIHAANVRYEAIPLLKRVKLFTYNGAIPIKSISCYDHQNSEASINITEGGIGFKHVTLRMKSQRSYRLDYAIEIYG
ncbi:unnamed protein product [Arctia plantaginis]|uniref:Salivary secreted peptide n=1 Tax=Arctia plantaginis TaxID=874455 RepID=A0A8S0ZMA3_ARCPL|nr:unnamed protein product [Arctia plantaginis]CAB3257522.1 unnamed protein product [Arctia plantaginis]